MNQVDIAESSPQEIAFQETVNRGITRARTIHQTRFGPNSDNPQIFHDWDNHINVLLGRVDRVYGAVRKVRPDLATTHSQGMARLLVAWHDIVQDFEVKDPATISETRSRKRIHNEDTSAQELITFMESEGGFSKEDIALVKPSVRATIPGFANGTVYQTDLNEQTPFEGITLALVDLGGAGMDGYGQFKKEGNNEFQEVRIGITRVVENILRSPYGWEGVNQAEKEYISKQIYDWIQGQVSFAEGRYARFEDELKLIPYPDVVEVLKGEVFNKFEESIDKTRERAGNLDPDNFDALVKEVYAAV